jgi:hypothetical protein
MTLKNTILTMHDDELGYEMYSKKVALQLSFKHTKRLLGSFGVTMTLKILCLGSRPPLKHIDESYFKIASIVNSVKPKVTREIS